MSLRRGTKFKHGYASVDADQGGHYRTISEVMTELGFKMNHSSARNHVIRIMAQFVWAFAQGLNVQLDEERVLATARSPSFQAAVCELLQLIEQKR